MCRIERIKDLTMTKLEANGPSHGSDEINSSTHSKDKSEKGSSKEKDKQLASIGQTLSFVWGCGPLVQFLFVLGFIAGIVNGMVFPVLAYLFSTSMSGLAGVEQNGMDQIREIAFIFMAVGVWALAAAAVQGWCFGIVSYHGSNAFRLAWFHSLLRQDPAYFGKMKRDVPLLYRIVVWR